PTASRRSFRQTASTSGISGMGCYIVCMPIAWTLTLVSMLAQVPEVPYIATTAKVVRAMLKLARVGPGDVVYDLGCGDGRIAIMAARKFGARGVGVDIDPVRIAEAEQNAREAGVSSRTRFFVGTSTRPTSARRRSSCCT